MSEPTHPTWIRIGGTPLNDLLHGRITGPFRRAKRYSAHVQTVQASNLPDPIKNTILKLISQTRLSRPEKLDIAHELISHFQDGLESDTDPAQLIKNFGNTRRAARLIGRAKKRNRPLPWRILVRSKQTLGIITLFLIISYTYLAVRFFTAKPNIARNYIAELNAADLAVPEQDRAWPHYRSAAIALATHELLDSDKWIENYLPYVDPNHESWPKVAAFIASNAHIYDQIRTATAIDTLGFLLSFEEDTELAEAIRPPDAPEPKPQPNQNSTQELQPLLNVLDLHLTVLRTMILHLNADTRHAAHKKDGTRFIADITATLNLSRHARQNFGLMSEIVSMASFSITLEIVRRTLAEEATWLSDAQLQELSHRIVAQLDPGPIRMNLEGERILFEDFVQRVYSDNGHGDGHLIAAALPQLVSEMILPGYSFYEQSITVGLPSKVLGPVAASALADRKEITTEYDRLLDIAMQDYQLAFWQLDESAIKREFAVLEDSHAWQVKYALLDIFFPPLHNAWSIAERATQNRDATVTIIALELHHRRHGAYPYSLAQLTPHFLPTVPIDRFDGQPLKYRLTESGPLLYSVGCDRTDDGGTPPRIKTFTNIEVTVWRSVSEIENAREGRAESALLGDWILYSPRNLSDTQSREGSTPSPDGF